MLTTMIAPSPRQQFSGMPSRATYTADNYGGIFNVQSMDILALLAAGCSLLTGPLRVIVPASGSAYTLLFPAFGDIWYDITLSAPCTFSIGASSPEYLPQIMRVLIRPNGFQATLPASGGSLVNVGGIAPTPSTSAITEYTYASDGTAPILGGV